MRTLILFFFLGSFMLSAQDKLPNISIKTLKNKPVNVYKDYSEKDKIYVFSFWATWCAPCISELEAISEKYEEWTSTLDMELVAVSIDDSRTQRRIRPMLNGRDWPYDVLIDDNQNLKRALSIVNIPYTVVVKNQKIEFIVNGYSQGAENELFESLKEL